MGEGEDKSTNAGKPVIVAENTAVDAYRNRLKPFLDNNRLSKVEELASPQACIAVTAPWGDDSLAIQIPEKNDTIIAALNRVTLPERYTAIYHHETGDFEIIFTAYPIGEIVDYLDRDFSFRFRGKAYNCKFGTSSKELLAIAEHSLGRIPGTTGHRNLPSFRQYVLGQNNVDGYTTQPGAKPISFWISKVEWEDNEVLQLVNHLNFFMTYYDTSSPSIIVHTPQSENYAKQPQTRFREGTFPKTIQGREIDDNLLYLWTASKTGDPARRFLYNYQIIEYSAHSFIEQNVRMAVKRIVAAPSSADNVDSTVTRILESIGQSDIHETQKIDLLLKEVVRPELIFREIEKSIDFFSKRIEFDGGFLLEPIAKKGWKEDDFGVNGLVSFAKTLRYIRNALSHGREQKSVAVIAPTDKNFERLQFWVPLVAVAAGEVVVYRGFI